MRLFFAVLCLDRRTFLFSTHGEGLSSGEEDPMGESLFLYLYLPISVLNSRIRCLHICCLFLLLVAVILKLHL